MIRAVLKPKVFFLSRFGYNRLWGGIKQQTDFLSNFQTNPGEVLGSAEFELFAFAFETAEIRKLENEEVDKSWTFEFQ